ncbi:MAG: FtsQ-type POTRA domain-containing protein [Myxococcales bacterium]|nr:FtsQ-type POTRA domain-containing protein [Myxococcales bacterium]
MAFKLSRRTPSEAVEAQPVNRAIARPKEPSPDDATATVSAPPVSRGVWLKRAFAGAMTFGRVALTLATLGGSIVGGRAVHRWLHQTPRFAARNLEVEGLRHTAREALLGAARLSPERNLLSIDGDAAARAMERLPWVAHARVTRQLPNTVRVVVEEREAAALLAAEGLYLVDARGELIKRVEAGDPTDLPVITGLSHADFHDEAEAAQSRVGDALALLGDIEASSAGPRVSAEEVHCEDTGELSVMLDGTYVWLGRGHYRAKLSRLRVVMAELRRRGLTAAEIHLESERHPERVTVRAYNAVAVAAR